MYEKLITEINKLPNVLTRQQLLNWYLDNHRPRWGSSPEPTTGQLIKLCKRCGKKIQGNSDLEIHVTLEQQADFIKRCKPDLTGRKQNIHVIMKDEYKDEVNELYWKKGKTIEQLAKKYECSKHTVESFMKKVGIPTRARGFSRAEG
jgi:hypothetical protein